MLDFIEMRKQLQKALAAGKVFITISYQDEEETIQHYYLTHNFPREDIMISLEHLSKEVLLESLDEDLPETLETNEETDT